MKSKTPDQRWAEPQNERPPVFGGTGGRRTIRRRAAFLAAAAIASVGAVVSFLPGRAVATASTASSSSLGSASGTSGPGHRDHGSNTGISNDVRLHVVAPASGQVETGVTLPIMVFAHGYSLDSFYAGSHLSA